MQIAQPRQEAVETEETHHGRSRREFAAPAAALFGAVLVGDARTDHPHRVTELGRGRLHPAHRAGAQHGIGIEEEDQVAARPLGADIAALGETEIGAGLDQDQSVAACRHLAQPANHLGRIAVIDQDEFVDTGRSEDRGHSLEQARPRLPGHGDNAQTRGTRPLDCFAPRKKTDVAANATVPWCHSCQTP